MSNDALLDRVIDAHGGAALWQRCRTIEAWLSSGGLAFASRFQRAALLDRKIRLDPHARRLTVEPYPEPGFIGTWTPDRVQVRKLSGEMMRERSDPRRAFASLAKQVRWDALDMHYFAGYALWNYLSFPFLLAEPGVEVRHAPGSAETISGCLTLHAAFSEEFPTHSREQRFHIDRETLLLRRHDYVANVIGRWASAANLCLASENVTGLRLYTRRRVYPRIGANFVVPFPTLVWIELTDVSAEMAEQHR